MYQEINITIEVQFLQKQIRKNAPIFDKEIEQMFDRRDDFTLNSLKSSMWNAILNITTSVDASLSAVQIKSITERRVEFIFPFRVNVGTLNLKEEAEIYGNV